LLPSHRADKLLFFHLTFQEVSSTCTTTTTLHKLHNNIALIVASVSFRPIAFNAYNNIALKATAFWLFVARRWSRGSLPGFLLQEGGLEEVVRNVLFLYCLWLRQVFKLCLSNIVETVLSMLQFTFCGGQYFPIAD
jgi:hypothetical protein